MTHQSSTTLDGPSGVGARSATGEPVADGPKRGRGRPRAADLEERALSATLQVFGEKGWTALTIDEVAARAKVGKSSIYLRWPDKTSLLTAALRAIQIPGAQPEAGDTGDPADPAGTSDDGGEGTPTPSLRDYLLGHARRRADLYLSENGLAMLRLYVEARAHPEVFADIRRQAITHFVLEERRRVEEAVQAGELAPRTSAVQLLDAVEGAIFMHVLVTPPHLVERVRSSLSDYIEEMVDNQLRAVGLTPRGS